MSKHSPEMPQKWKKMSPKRALWVVALAGGAALVGGAPLAWHYCTAHTVEPAILEQIRPGMSWEQARTILGTDLMPERTCDGENMVGLRKRDRWCMVDIFISDDGKVTSVFHDH